MKHDSLPKCSKFQPMGYLFKMIVYNQNNYKITTTINKQNKTTKTKHKKQTKYTHPHTPHTPHTQNDRIVINFSKPSFSLQ